MRKAVVVGLGEVGRSLLKVFQDTYGEAVAGYDISGGDKPSEFFDQVHVCIPYSSDFTRIVNAYQSYFQPAITVIHSTVPVGTTAKLLGCVCHSPVLGNHGNMGESLKAYVKWVGGRGAPVAAAFMNVCGFKTKVVERSEETELLKLFCLAKYGMAVAFSKYEQKVFAKHGLDAIDIERWDEHYNSGLWQISRAWFQRPVIVHEQGPIGGHCVVPGVRLLNQSDPHPLLNGILDFEPRAGATTIWQPSNIYPTAKLGKDVSIGSFSEIGNEVEIGDRTRVGAFAFIPEGFTIGRDVFIGPRFCGTNDKFPPSSRENWLKTTIKDGARVGAAVTMLCGITVGEKSLIGAGSVVTHDVPSGETWAGVPARKIEHKEAVTCP